MSRIILERISLDLNPNDYNFVYTPTKAVARSLKTPHRTLEGRAETIVRKSGWRIASTLLTRRLLQKAIAKILKVQDIAGITALWTPAIQELISSGADLKTLAQNSLVRVQELAQVAIYYQQQLRAINCLDRSELFWQATKCYQLASETNAEPERSQLSQSCLFYGYFAPNRDQLAFINAIAGDNSLLVLPNEERAIFKDNHSTIEWLVDQGWQVANSEEVRTNKHLGQYLSQQYLVQTNSAHQTEQTEQDNSEPDSNVRLHHYANLDAEVRGVLTQVKLLLSQGVKPQSIVLVSKDEQLYGKTLLDVAWEYDLPIRAFYEIPFLDTRIGAWLEMLIEAIANINETGDLPFELGSKLLAHPLVKQLNNEIWQEARLIYPQSLEAWQNLGVDLSVLTLPAQAENQEWLTIFQGILEHFSIKDKASPWAKEIVAYYKFQDTLQELLFSSNQELTRQDFLTEMQELLTSLTIPIQPGRGGVELHSPLSLFGCSYEYVFVLGMAENIFPTAVSDDLVLGFRDRKQLTSGNFNFSLNLNTILKIITRESLTFYFLLHIPTKQIIFSYPQAIDRQPVFPSPYLQKLNLQAQPLELEYLASIETARRVYLLTEQKIEDDLLPIAVQKWQIERDRLSKNPDPVTNQEYFGRIDIPLDFQQRTFSASQLTQLGQCPFKWFASRLLKLKEAEESSLTLDSKIKGILYHRCLELCLKKVKTAADLANLNVKDLLQEAFNQAEQEQDIPDIPAWVSQKQELLNLLAINLSSPDFLPSDSEIVALEEKFTTQWHGLSVRGTIDRLDRTASGLKVVDYKSSGSVPPGVKDAVGKATVDLQIPLYADAIAEQYPDESVGAVYYSLSKHKAISTRRQSEPEELANFAEEVKQRLEMGNYPIEPDVQLKACSYCQFDLVCRYQ